MVDTGAGFLLRTGESKARERRFFQPKEFDEEMCLDCQLPFRNSELRYCTKTTDQKRSPLNRNF